MWDWLVERRVRIVSSAVLAQGGERVTRGGGGAAMSSILPDTPHFETPVYGTVFAERAAVVRRLRQGDQLILVPDPPGVDEPSVWVHAPGGDVVGHLSPDINAWMAPRMLGGARYGARVQSVGEPETASWKRLVIRVRQVGVEN
jgi:hypothetical protein